MKNTQQYNSNPVTLKAREPGSRSINPAPDIKGYYIPSWLQEVLQELRSQNNKKTVVC
jgi:hypothetical protein